MSQAHTAVADHRPSKRTSNLALVAPLVRSLCARPPCSCARAALFVCKHVERFH